MADSSSAGGKKQGSVGIKETLTSLIIAFMLAFLFRGFVIEGFLIPTGSMAPTLLGQHIRMTGKESGYDWAVGPWTIDRNTGQPVRTQTGIVVQDPMTGIEQGDTNRRLAAGDRVFVLKYLPWLHHPQRWDVVVFKNPGEHINYIKRLVGLPGEQVAFVDGDVFTRPFVEDQTARSGWDAWAGDGWAVQRKPERVQRTMLQDVFDSGYAPEQSSLYQSPFSAGSSGWSGVDAGRRYRYEGSGATALEWNDRRPLTDLNAYNQTDEFWDLFRSPQVSTASWAPRHFVKRPFPTADLALSLNIRGEREDLTVSPVIAARGMEFTARVSLGDGRAVLLMRDASTPDMPWTELDAGNFGAVGAGTWANIEFWHIDQALWLFVDGELVAGGREGGAYELSPAQRAVAATGMGWEELQDYSGAGDGRSGLGVFAETSLYREPSVRWDFEGGAFELSRVKVQRDISYHINQNRVTRGAHPNYFPTLSEEQFFMCGDNSSNSADSRLWSDDEIYPWVRTEIDDTPGSVHRDLIVGKAFVVYFPAPLDDGPILAPDFGRLRWIW